MVALLKTKSGYVIQFGPDRSRLTVPLGDVSRRAAETVRTHLRHLERAARTQTLPPAATDEWLKGVSEKIHAKLVRSNLAAPRHVRPAHALGPFVKGYVEKRTDLKPRTILNLRQAEKSLVGFFGAGRDLGSITPGEAADWRRGLAAKLAPATVSTHVKKARQFFADAIDRRLIEGNPFGKLKAGKQSNEARMQYVTRETIQKVIDACPDAEWRLLFATVRFAGLRVPSEIRPLKWSDVFGFAADRMKVHSPKTEHHAGGEARWVPIFPDLRPYLLEAFEAAEDGALFVFARLRDKALVSQAEKIIDKAGVPRWRKLWQNLRSSCQTDLEARHPSHVACAWMGNSERVARKHYLQVTEADYRAALGAALASEHARTAAETPNANARGITGNYVSPIPPRGCGPKPKITAKKLGVDRAALRRALRNSKEHSHPLVHKANVAALRRQGRGA